MKTPKLTTAAALVAALASVAAAAPKAFDGLALDNPRFLDLGSLPDLDTAAGNGLQRFRGFLGHSATGASESAPGKAGLGKPQRDFLIRLDALKAYRAGQDPEALLVDTRLVHFPVQVDGKTRGSLTFARGEKAWSLVSVGEENRSDLREKAIGASIRRFARGAEAHFIVRIPALRLEFTAFRDGNGALQLASITDHVQAGLVAGEAEAATRVLPRLVPLAKSHDGLPR